MKIYAAQYNPCYHESSYGTLSLHRTYQGACVAVRQHEKKILEEWKDMGYDAVPEYELWRVQEIDLEE